MCVQEHVLLNLGWKPLKAARTMNSRDEGFHGGIVLAFCIQVQRSGDKGRPFLVGREQREDWRLDESKRTDQLRVIFRHVGADKSTIRVPHKVHRREFQGLDERAHVLGVQFRRVVFRLSLQYVRPVVTPAERNDAVVVRQSVHLTRPHGEVTEASVNEQNRSAVSVFYVCETHSICPDVFDVRVGDRRRSNQQKGKNTT